MPREKLKPEDEEYIRKNYRYLKKSIDASDIIDYLFQHVINVNKNNKYSDFLLDGNLDEAFSCFFKYLKLCQSVLEHINRTGLNMLLQRNKDLCFKIDDLFFKSDFYGVNSLLWKHALGSIEVIKWVRMLKLIHSWTVLLYKAHWTLTKEDLQSQPNKFDDLNGPLKKFKEIIDSVSKSHCLPTHLESRTTSLKKNISYLRTEESTVVEKAVDNTLFKQTDDKADKKCLKDCATIHNIIAEIFQLIEIINEIMIYSHNMLNKFEISLPKKIEIYESGYIINYTCNNVDRECIDANLKDYMFKLKTRNCKIEPNKSSSMVEDYSFSEEKFQIDINVKKQLGLLVHGCNNINLTASKVSSPKYSSEDKKIDEKDVSQDQDIAERNILKEILSSKNIRINPEVINIYIAGNPQRHPANLCNIPWSFLNEEKWRLLTFARYPQNAPKSAILLAHNGFAYLGCNTSLDDTVICFFCESVKKNWQPSDDILEVHKQLSGNCSMVTNINCRNIPLETKHTAALFNQVYDHGRNSDLEHDGEMSETVTHPVCNDEHEANKSNSASIKVCVQNLRNEHRTGFPQQHQRSIPSSIDFPPSTIINPQHSTTTGTVLSSPSTTTISASSPLLSDSLTPVATLYNGNTVFSTSAGLVSGLSNSLTVSATPSNPPPDVHAVQVNASAGQSTSPVATPSNTVSRTTLNSSQNTVKSNANGPTYSELGIVTERPKRFEYALLAKRMETFLSWPRDHHLIPKELAEAGFYYAGYGDCARCFYCGGGLRNWEDEDDVWVEHARWFPKCAYIRQQMGQVFVDTVQKLNKTKDHISFAAVMKEIGQAVSSFQLDSKDNPLKRDPAVKTIQDMGYPLAEIIAVAEVIKEDGNILSADKILEKLVSGNIRKNSNSCKITEISTDGAESESAHSEKLLKLKEKNNQLRQQTTCKICMDKDVAVVFLPCGHLVSCTDCAAAMKDCPVCRNHVKGIVRAFMG